MLIAGLFAASCAQKEEKRDEYKEEHSANEMVNDLGDSAVAATDSTTVVTDSTEVK